MSFDFSLFPRIEIGGKRVKQIARKSDGQILWTAGYINMVPLSINADGTIYNGTGYKNGYRVRSGGAETTAVNGSCTGFIPVKGGDIVRLSGWPFSAIAENAINASDSSFSNLGQLVGNYTAGGYGIFSVSGAYSAYSWASIVKESDGVWKWVVPPAASGVAYIRVSGYSSGGAQGGPDGSNMIVTINEEIT